MMIRKSLLKDLDHDEDFFMSYDQRLSSSISHDSRRYHLFRLTIFRLFRTRDSNQVMILTHAFDGLSFPLFFHAILIQWQEDWMNLLCPC